MHRPLVHLAVIFSAITVPAAAQFPRWEAPQTLINLADEVGEAPPCPTDTPAYAAHELVRRVRPDNVCGYVSGLSVSSISCNAGFGSCVVNNFASVVGCCNSAAVSQCQIPTTCVGFSDSLLLTTTGNFTNYCGSSQYPSCVTYIYTGDYFSGDTLFGCGRASTQVFISANAVRTTDSSSTAQPPSGSTSLPIPASVSPAPTVTLTLTPEPAPVPVSSNGGTSVPVGAAVGGVVGGVALLGLVAFALFLLWRKRRSVVITTGYPNPDMDQVNPRAQLSQLRPGFVQPDVTLPRTNDAAQARDDGKTHGGASASLPEARSPSLTDSSFRSHYPSGVPSVLSTDSNQHYTPLAYNPHYSQSLSHLQPYLQSQHNPAFPHTGNNQHLPPLNASELATERGDHELQELA